MNIDDVTKGLVSGILIAVLLLYSFRPQVPYPLWMLQIYEHPWMFLVLILSALLLTTWDVRNGSLMCLVVAAFIVDYYTLGKRLTMTKSE